MITASTRQSDTARRTAHGQTMDRLYRSQRHIYDLTRKYYLFGRDRLIAELAVPAGGRVLEVGCGTGRNLAKAARRYPDASFYGVDISGEMLCSADASARRAGVAGRVFTRRGDAETFDACAAFSVPGFDRVVFSYSLSMVPRWRRALAGALGQTAPGGSLHVVDFGQMEAWPAFLRMAMRRWLAHFHVEPRAGLIDHAETLGRLLAFDVRTDRVAGGYAWMIVLTRTREAPMIRPDVLSDWMQP